MRKKRIISSVVFSIIMSSLHIYHERNNLVDLTLVNGIVVLLAAAISGIIFYYCFNFFDQIIVNWKNNRKN